VILQNLQIHEKANLQNSVFRIPHSTFRTGSQGQRPRPAVPRRFLLRFIEKENGEGLQKSDSFFTKNFEFSNFVKI